MRVRDRCPGAGVFLLCQPYPVVNACLGDPKPTGAQHKVAQRPT